MSGEAPIKLPEKTEVSMELVCGISALVWVRPTLDLDLTECAPK